MRLVFSYVLTVSLYGVFIPAVGLKCGTFLDRAFGLPPMLLNGVNRVIGLAVILVAVALIAWAFHSIRTIGKGHPHEIFNVKLAPTTSRLIVRGPYKYTRNPMCLGFTLLMAGLGLFIGSLSTTVLGAGTYLLCGAFYLKFVEEKGLIKRFGEGYLHYRDEIPMIVPGLKVKGSRANKKLRQESVGRVAKKFRVADEQNESEAT
jgi:protein-S-isoprenylcysteine O-methyltransferase Ste14